MSILTAADASTLAPSPGNSLEVELARRLENGVMEQMMLEAMRVRALSGAASSTD